MPETTRPKILFCMHMPPPVHGAAMMGKYIRDSILINNTFDCRYVNIATANSLNDLGHGGLKKILLYIKMLKSTLRLIKAFHPDLIYVTPASFGMSFYKDYLMVQLFKRRCGSIVLHYHNKGVAQHSNKWWYRVLYSRFFDNAKVILLSDALYPDVANFVSGENLLICPNGIPNQKQAALHIQHSNIQLLFLSNLMRSKGVITLLDALAIINDKQVHCHIAGAPGDVSVLQLQEEIQKRHLMNVVTYHGFADAEQKCDLLAQADVFVFPTERDCFPLVLLEAMRGGIPCITTAEGAISDIVDDGQTGWIIDQGDAEMLAQKIEWLLRHPQERVEMGRAGKDKFEQLYTLASFERNMANVLTQCLNQ